MKLFPPTGEAPFMAVRECILRRFQRDKGDRLAAISNDAKPPGSYLWYEVRNADDKPAEVLVYDAIGKDPWDGSGIGEKDFRDALNKIPKGKPINLRINSGGGSVWAGLAIYNTLSERRADVTAYIDGVAASVASWIALAGNKVIIPENGTMMIHNPSTIAWGDENELGRAINTLKATKASIVSMYRAKTGKSEKEISDAMDAETWFVGQAAKNWGLADEVAPLIQNVQNNFDLSRFKNVPEAIAKLAAKPPENTPKNSAQGSGANDRNTMNREAIIALLKEQGIEVQNSVTDEQLQALLKEALTKAKAQPENKQPQPDKEQDATIAALQNAVKALTDQAENSRKASVTAEINKLIENNQLPANMRDKYIARAVKDETVLDEYRAMPVVMPGAEPVSAVVEIKNESPEQVVKAWNRFNEPGNALCRGNSVEGKVIANSALARAMFFVKNRARIIEVFNANSFDAGLQRQVVLQESIRAYAKVLAPFRGFATTFRNVPLQGTDKVDVPYYPLATAASTDFSSSYSMGDTTINAREITVDKRKYQPIRFTSSELRRQPFIDLARIFEIKAEKLAIDVFQNILSVVTNANYGAAAKVEAAATFDLNDVADIRDACNTANWPMVGRVLLLDSAYDTNLFKQAGLQRVNEYGGADVIRDGAITRLMGFEYYQSPNIPGNAENLKGFAGFMSAILVALSPVEPVGEVRSQLTSYQVFTDAETQVSFENRVWGNPDSDERREVVEANYGFAKGEGAGIKRVTSA